MIDDATELAQRIANGELNAAEALDAAIDRAERANGELNFLAEEMYDRARERATQPMTGPFAGVPYMLKDMWDVAGTTTGFGSRLRAVSPPAAANYAMIDALEAAGLNIFAKTTLGEFGYLPPTESEAHGITRNPWNTDHTPGGSSGGTAAAVAAGVVPMSDAADGGGSIRIPAACCGLFGLKPSRKRMIGDFGADSTVHLVVQNCISRTVRDTANLMAVTERTGADAVLDPIGHVTGASQRRLRVGVVRDGVTGVGPSSEVTVGLDNTIELLRGLGHEVVDTAWPFSGEDFMAAFGAVWVSGAAKVNGLIAGVAGEDALPSLLEPYTIGLGQIGASVTDADVDAAVLAIESATAASAQWHEQFDVILSPVTQTPPVAVGVIDGNLTAETASRVGDFVSVTMVQNATGFPAMSVPLHWTDDGLPIGMQFAGGLGTERMLLELAFELEDAQPWAHRTPPLWVAD